MCSRISFNKMKVVIASVLLLAVASVAEHEYMVDMKAKMDQRLQNCGVELSASESDLDIIRNVQIPTSHDGKCVLFCMHKKFDIQFEEGGLNIPGSLEEIEKIKPYDEEIYTKVRAIFNVCKETPSVSDPCEFAGDLVECLFKESKLVGLLEVVFE